MSKLEDGMYLMTEPLTGASYMVRLITPGKVQVVSRDGVPEAGARVSDCLKRGYIFAPLVAPLPVPIDDIERALRAAEPVLGIHREGRLLLRRVQAWLDGLPKAEVRDATPTQDL